MTNERLSEALLASRLLTTEQLGAIVEAHQRQGGTLSKHIIASGFIEEAAFRDFLAAVFRVQAVDLANLNIDAELIKLVPEEIATRFQLVPVSRQGRVLEVAMANPDNLFAIDDLKFYTGLEIRPLVAPEQA
ncbi:type II secretion system protein GspE, partial [bacterium]|nr:type II secretion system protein GspE [bacterium]